MIESIFENLFKPVSDDENFARHAEMFQYIRQLEEQIEGMNDHEAKDVVVSFYDKLPDEGLNWWALFRALRGRNHPFFDMRERELIKLYKKWKAQQ